MKLFEPIKITYKMIQSNFYESWKAKKKFSQLTFFQTI